MACADGETAGYGVERGAAGPWLPADGSPGLALHSFVTRMPPSENPNSL